jgi:hypothetical protein
MLSVVFLSCKNDKYETSLESKKMDIKKVEEEIVNNKFKYTDLVAEWKTNSSNEFYLMKKIDDFKFTAIYKPYSILVMEELQDVNIEDTISIEFQKKTANYSNMHFLNFSIENETYKNELIKLDVENNQAYYDRITYYSFAAKNEAYIVEDKDTLKCDFINFERTFEAKPSIMLSIGFTRKSKTNNYNKLKFVFEDKIFNKGKLIFNFDPQPILLLNYLKPLS